MNRIFITTDRISLKLLFKNTKGESKAENFNIPCTIMESKLVIHVINDTLNFPGIYNIDKENDCILYHSSSHKDVINSITTSFTHFKNGSHEYGSLHQKVFNILFDDKNTNKFNDILDVLGFTEEKIKEKEIQDSKLDFLYHIYNGGKPKDFDGGLDDFKIEESLYSSFNDTPYDISLDLKEYENTGKEQRQNLASLRDALLGN